MAGSSQPPLPATAIDGAGTGSIGQRKHWATATQAASQQKAWKGILAGSSFAAAVRGQCADEDEDEVEDEPAGADEDTFLADASAELEDETFSTKGSQLGGFVRQQLTKLKDQLKNGTATSLVQQGPAVLFGSGEPHELYASTHTYCVLALHYPPLNGLVRDPRVTDKRKIAVLCPRCHSGSCTQFKCFFWDRVRRLPQPQGVLIVLNGKYRCVNCPKGEYTLWGRAGGGNNSRVSIVLFP